MGCACKAEERLSMRTALPELEAFGVAEASEDRARKVRREAGDEGGAERDKRGELAQHRGRRKADNQLLALQTVRRIRLVGFGLLRSGPQNRLAAQ